MLNQKMFIINTILDKLSSAEFPCHGSFAKKGKKVKLGVDYYYFFFNKKMTCNRVIAMTEMRRAIKL